MLTARRLVGLSVVALADGREIGQVKHVLLDTENARVVGLAVDTGCWWRGCPVVPVDKVVGMGEEAVTVPDSDVLSQVETHPGVERIARAERPLVGQLVLSREGTALGTVSDYAFDLHGGRITSLEVAPPGAGEGEGPVLVRADQVLVYGRDAIVVSGGTRSEAGRAAAEQGPVAGKGGVAAIAGASEPAGALVRESAGREPGVPGTAEAADVSPPEAPPLEGGRREESAGLAAVPAAELARLFQERQERFLLGKTAQRAVRGEDGGIIVAAGEAVTAELLAKVKEAGRLLDLTASVSLRP